MKVRTLTLAVVAALATSSAFALTPVEISAARTAGTLKEVWLSGATAPTRNVFEGFKKDCIDTVDFYTSDALGTVPGSAGNFTAYACTTNTLGKTVAYHTLDGGSFNAFAPHVVGTQLARVKKIESAACVANGTTPNVYNSCLTVNPVTAPDGSPAKPDGGVSDVESTLFQDLFTTAPSSVGTEAFANVGQVFGLAVSTNLYRALQTKQGIVAAGCLDDTYVTASKTYTQVGLHDFRDPACVPNISKAQYTSIAASGGGYQTDWSPILGAAGAGKAVNLCRRVPTSGTQASSNAYFMDNPCNRGSAAGQLVPIDAASSSIDPVTGLKILPTAASGILVTENSGTSDVKKCLNKANDNATKYFAIGVVSTENDPFQENLADRDDYRFVKLDGVSPENAGDDRARQNAINGDYGFAMEIAAYTANSASVSGASMISTIVANMGDPAGADLRGLFVSPAGGADHTLFPTQVHKGTKFGLNCAPWNMVF